MADLGLVSYHEGDYAGAEAVFERSLLLFRQYDLKDRVAGVLNLLGDLARLAGDGERAAGCYDESLALWRELRGTPGIASALHKLGQVSRAVGDGARARAYFVESLALQRELGNRQGIGECLTGLAGNLAPAGQPERATRILAAGAALLESIGVPLAPADQAAFTDDVAVTRRRLGGAAWEAAWAAGRALSTEDAIGLALTEDARGQPVAAGERNPARPAHPTRTLSRREREVTALVARGLSNREISAALVITEKTVANHIEHVMTKLGLRSRTRVAVWAIEHGLGRTRPG